MPEQLTAALEGKAPDAPEAEAASKPEPGPAPATGRPPRKFRPVAEELREIERERMVEALSATFGVKARAAELIGMPIRTFTLKCKQYGL